MTTDDADLAEERATSDCCGAAICFSLEHDNFYCVRCNRGQGCAFYDKHQANWRDFPAGNRDKPAAVPASPQAAPRPVADGCRACDEYNAEGSIGSAVHACSLGARFEGALPDTRPPVSSAAPRSAAPPVQAVTVEGK